MDKYLIQTNVAQKLTSLITVCLTIGDECGDGSLSGRCNNLNICEYNPVLALANCGKNTLCITYVGGLKLERDFFPVLSYLDIKKVDSNVHKRLMIQSLLLTWRADLTCHVIRNSLRLCCVDQSGTSIQILPEPRVTFIFINLTPLSDYFFRYKKLDGRQQRLTNKRYHQKVAAVKPCSRFIF